MWCNTAVKTGFVAISVTLKHGKLKPSLHLPTEILSRLSAAPRSSRPRVFRKIIIFLSRVLSPRNVSGRHFSVTTLEMFHCFSVLIMLLINLTTLFISLQNYSILKSKLSFVIIITGPPTHSVGASIVLLWRPLSSVGVCNTPGRACRRLHPSCRLQSNYSSTVILHGGPVVLRPVRASPC